MSVELGMSTEASGRTSLPHDCTVEVICGLPSATADASPNVNDS